MTLLTCAIIVIAVVSGAYFWGSVLHDVWRWWVRR